MVKWKTACQSAYTELLQVESSGRIVYPKSITLEGLTSSDLQKRVCLLEQYIRFINGQLGLGYAFDLNFLFIISKTTKLLGEQGE